LSPYSSFVRRHACSRLQPKVKGDFATLFMRDPNHALVYNGMVVERKVYEIGLAYLKRQMDEKLASAYGLQEAPA
jgi:hypothetical protein